MKYIFLITIIIIVAAGLIYINIKGYLLNSISDEELINKTKELDEVKIFLNKYPNANVIVDKSGKLAVDYRVDDMNSYIRLRIFINPLTNGVEDMFIECYTDKSEKVRNNIIDYINTRECI